MKVTKPLSVLALVAGCLGAQACVTDNPAAYEGILGPEREPSEEPTSGGGTGGSGIPTGGSGGSGATTGGTSGTGGMGDGGQTQGGSAGSGGSTMNPPPHPDFMPPCFSFLTTGGEEPAKGVSCGSDDVQECYRPCGPAQVGWKLESCRAGVYVEDDCRFPLDGDYSCFRLPVEPATEGPTPIDCGLTAAPAAREECSVDVCTPCNFEGYYEDTAGGEKEGYCVCEAGEADPMGKRRWTCASGTAWPCPNSQGCF